MERIEKSILVEAEPERVYDFIAEPRNLLEIWPSLVQVGNVETKAGGGMSWDWTYKMAGLHFHGRSETGETERPRRRTLRNEGGIRSTIEWTFAEREHGTEVTFRVEYEPPLALLGKLAAPFLRRLNDREADTLLANLKERLEAGEVEKAAAQPATTVGETRPHT